MGTRGDDVSERRQAGRVESRSCFAEKNRARPVVPPARLRYRRGGGLPNPGTKPPVSRIRGRALRRLRRPTRRGRGCRPLTCGERLNQALAAVLEVVRDVFDRAWSLHRRISKAAPRPDPTRETRARWRSMRGRRTSRGTGRATSVRVTFPARQTRLGTCAPRQCAVTSTRGFLERSDFAEKQKFSQNGATGCQAKFAKTSAVLAAAECGERKLTTEHAWKEQKKMRSEKKSNALHLVRDERVFSELAPAYHEEVHARRRPSPGV